MDETKEVGRGGRKPRGDRHTLMPSFPSDHYDWYSRQATASGLLFSEYVCAELAREHGLEVPDYIKDDPALVPVHELLPLPIPSGKKRRGTVRVPASHFRHYKDLAQRHGLPVADYVLRSLAARNGLDPVDLYDGRDLLGKSA